MTHIEELVNVLNGHKVFVQTHNVPDPDAISTAFGLQYLLKEYDIESTIVYDGELSKLSGLKLIDYLSINIVSLKDAGYIDESDYVVLVDCQKYNKNCTDIPGDEVACIDHHPTMIDCEYKYKDVRIVGSCSSLIASYYQEAEIEMPYEVATALLYGLKMDTSDFNRGVTEFDISMFHYLYQRVDQDVLKKLSMNTIALSDLKAYGAAINDISIYKNIGFASIPFDCPDALTAIISDFILALDVVEFSVVFNYRNGGYKFSVRSELKSLDCGKIIKVALENLGGSGGGHSFMSGGYLPREAVDALGSNKREKIEQTFMKLVYPEDFPGTFRIN